MLEKFCTARVCTGFESIASYLSAYARVARNISRILTKCVHAVQESMTSAYRTRLDQGWLKGEDEVI